MRSYRKTVCAAALLFFVSLIVVSSTHLVSAQTATISVSPSTNVVSIGETLTVHIEISNIQNLYGVDIALTWDTSMLKLDSNQSFVGVSSGVLNPPILEVQDSASQVTGEYNLIATSENPAGPWSGSATVATLTFTVTHDGQSSLTLESSSSSSPELASYVQPGSGEVSEPISVNVVNGLVTTSSPTPSPSSSATTSTSPTPSATPSTSSSPTGTGTPKPTSTPKVPEYSLIVILPLLITAPFVLLVKQVKKEPKKQPCKRRPNNEVSHFTKIAQFC